MHGEGILGPLPPGYSFRFTYGPIRYRPVYFTTADERNAETQRDPRLGDLPPGWRFAYEGTPESEEQEYDADGILKHQFYRDRRGQRTWDDPRLNIESLRKRGVNIQDLILI